MTADTELQGWMNELAAEQPLLADIIAAHVTATIRHAAAHAPRSLQTAVGPSQLGTPCTRRLAYSAIDWDPKPNDGGDPWTAVIGTSVHAWMAETFAVENRKLEGLPNAGRYLIEHRIHLPGGISGSCDLYDRDTDTVIDWKVTSPANIKKYQRNGPGQQYRTQGNLYALGLQLQGYQPRNVAIVFLPRGGRLDGLYVWTEPYQPQIAAEALGRYEAVKKTLWTISPRLNIEAHPDRWSVFPTADAYCTFCPWFLPASSDLSRGCPGHGTIADGPSAVDQMIA